MLNAVHPALEAVCCSADENESQYQVSKVDCDFGVLFHLIFDSTRTWRNGEDMEDKYWARHSRHVDNNQVDHLVTSIGLAATQFRPANSRFEKRRVQHGSTVSGRETLADGNFPLLPSQPKPPMLMKQNLTTDQADAKKSHPRPITNIFSVHLGLGTSQRVLRGPKGTSYWKQLNKNIRPQDRKKRKKRDEGERGKQNHGDDT